MNIHRYDTEKRRNWVLDKITRAKTVRQICQEAYISRATLYNWIEEFESDPELKVQAEQYRTPSPKKVEKVSRPDLLNSVNAETGEKYRMLVSAIESIDHSKAISKKLAAVLIKRFTLSVSQACAIVGLDESAYGYKPRKPEVEDYIVYEGLVNLIREDRSRSFDQLYDLLLEKNPDWTRKQIKRVYRDGMVYLERTRKKKTAEDGVQTLAVPAVEPLVTLPKPARLSKEGGTWNMGLIEDAVSIDGVPKPIWLLFLFDEETGQQINAVSGVGNITTENVLAFLDKAVSENGNPKKLKIPGKPALTVRELTKWVWEHRMALHTFSLQKPENVVEIARLEGEVKAALQLDKGISYHQLETNIEGWILAGEVV